MAEALPSLLSTPILLLALILVALSVFCAIALSETPFSLAHKKASLTKLNSGCERVSVTIDIYNRGLSTVYDLSAADDSWSLDVFDVVTGNTSKSWKTVDGGAHVSHSFELEPKAKSVYHGAAALITFRLPTKSKKLPAKHGSHILVILLVGCFAHIIVSPSKSSTRNVIKKRN
ncbi:uncharacterized protein [Coffea arabica]|uniref:Uncharacterized protein n=1 Tax=Coffea arabica TaxID=13443 RepID=A0A6P6X8D4_COFAR|nr:translocon-associated protein subunit beta-like [Coffea arabica]